VPADPLPESLDQLRSEVAALRASRERLVLAADAERRAIERELHRGVQQHLVALAVNLQLAGMQVDADPEGAKAAIEDMRRDVEQAVGEAAELAQRIDPPLLEAGLAVAVREAVASLGFPVSVDVETTANHPSEVARTVLLCCRQLLERTGARGPASVTVREENGDVVVQVVAKDASPDDPGGLRDRVEALGGRLSLDTDPGGTTRLAASLPVSR
jgi:signal transduction histidine kinase